MAEGVKPLISIVTPVYNGAKYLDELIVSVQQQDSPHVEHIVIDDGSTDNGATVAVLKRYPHLRWWSRENKGQYATLNEGLAASTGSIIGIISADDKYVVPSTFSSVLKFWESQPQSKWIYGRTLRMDSAGTLLPPDPTLQKEPFASWFIRYRLLIQHCSVFVDKQLIVDNGIWFDPTYRYVGDWDWIIRLSISGRRAYLDKALSVYREHDDQTMQRATRRRLFEEGRRVRQKYKANTIIYWLLVYQHRFMKAVWLLRQAGVQGLYRATKTWLKQH